MGTPAVWGLAGQVLWASHGLDSCSLPWCSLWLSLVAARIHSLLYSLLPSIGNVLGAAVLAYALVESALLTAYVKMCSMPDGAYTHSGNTQWAHFLAWTLGWSLATPRPVEADRRPSWAWVSAAVAAHAAPIHSRQGASEEAAEVLGSGRETGRLEVARLLWEHWGEWVPGRKLEDAGGAEARRRAREVRAALEPTCTVGVRRPAGGGPWLYRLWWAR